MPAMTAVRVASSRPSSLTSPTVLSVSTTKPSSARISCQLTVRSTYETKNGRMMSRSMKLFQRPALNAMK
jgi:hypothetical protein